MTFDQKPYQKAYARLKNAVFQVFEFGRKNQPPEFNAYLRIVRTTDPDLITELDAAFDALKAIPKSHKPKESEN